MERKKKERKGKSAELSGLKTDGTKGGKGGEMGGYVREDRVRASSLGSIGVSKYGGVRCCRPAVKTHHRAVRRGVWKEDG